MKLPIYELKDTGQLNANPTAPPLSIIGPGYIEENYLDVTLPYKTFLLSGLVGYVTTEEYNQDFTLEVTGVDTVPRGVLFSTGDYRYPNSKMMVVMLSNRNIVVRHYTATGGYTNVYSRREDKILEAKSVQVIRQDNVLQFYIDGVRTEYDHVIDPEYREGTVKLLCMATDTDVVLGNPGNYENVRFSPKHVLEPFMFYQSRHGGHKDYEMSITAVSPIVPLDFTELFVATVSNYDDHVIVGYTDGSLESFSRPRGEDKGNYIKNIYKTPELDMYIVFNNDVELLVGKVPETKETILGTNLVGSGYKSGTQMIPFRAEGNLYYVENGIVKANKLTQIALNYQLRVRYLANISTTRLTALRLITDDNGWAIYPTTPQFGVKAPVTTFSGKVFLTPGEYYCEGFVTLRATDSTVVGILNDQGVPLLMSSNVGTGNRGTAGSHSTKVQGKFVVGQPTQIRVGYKYSDPNPLVPYIITETRLADINIFKVA